MKSTVQPDLFRTGTAEFSSCGQYRYELRRMWGAPEETPNVLNMLMLNPSRATALESDATVSRCVERAQMLGFNGLVVSNIFAWRSTDPWALYDLPDPTGPFNDDWILESARASAMTICGWGGHGKLHNRGRRVEAMLRAAGVKLYALRISQITGEPGHPLYVGYSVQPVEWVSAR